VSRLNKAKSGKLNNVLLVIAIALFALMALATSPPVGEGDVIRHWTFVLQNDSDMIITDVEITLVNNEIIEDEDGGRRTVSSTYVLPILFSDGQQLMNLQEPLNPNEEITLRPSIFYSEPLPVGNARFDIIITDENNDSWLFRMSESQLRLISARGRPSATDATISASPIIFSIDENGIGQLYQTNFDMTGRIVD